VKPLERLTHRVTFRTGIIALGAMTCLALPSTSASARRVELAALAATALGEREGGPRRQVRSLGEGPDDTIVQ
jgi:hypothetical protein